ncbi:MAG: hypothetical protein AABZ12_13245 [Planctomycetota bacterium]
MRFEYDPHLVEQATFLVAQRNPERECVLHEVLDPLYRINDPETRQRAFRDAYAALFQRFGLDHLVPSYIREFPLAATQLNHCIVREAERSRAQSVDLYTKQSDDPEGGGERVLILALCPESLLAPQRLTPWMYRQLQHVEDMVDQRFAYERKLPSASVVKQNLIRDRYAVLWDVYVEGRLNRSGKLPDEAVGLWRSFSKAFARNGISPPRIAFDSLWDADGLTHAQLMAWATDPAALLKDGEQGDHQRTEDALACAASAHLGR